MLCASPVSPFNFTREQVASAIQICEFRMLMTICAPPSVKKSLKSRCILAAFLIGALLGTWWIKQRDPGPPAVLYSHDDTLGPVEPRALEDVSTLQLYTEEVTYFQDCGFEHQPGQIEVGRGTRSAVCVRTVFVIRSVQTPAVETLATGSHRICLITSSSPHCPVSGLHRPDPSVAP